MHKITLAVVIICGFFLSPAMADDTTELSAIKKAALDYMEAWYQGDADRMKGSLHKKLAKRSLKGLYGESELRHVTRRDMVAFTSQGYGRGLWRKEYNIEVVVLDRYSDIASVKVVAPHYLEYLHLGKVASRWVIINTLYEKKAP